MQIDGQEVLIGVLWCGGMFDTLTITNHARDRYKERVRHWKDAKGLRRWVRNRIREAVRRKPDIHRIVRTAIHGKSIWLETPEWRFIIRDAQLITIEPVSPPRKHAGLPG